MTIRLAQRTDGLAITELVVSLSHRYLNDSRAALPLWFSNTLDLAAYHERFSSADYWTVVFEQNGNIDGYLSVKSGSHLYHLFVAEAVQGQGIARRLWQYARSHLGASAYTVRSSLNAVPVYQAFGFVKSGPVGTRDGISFQPMVLSHGLSV